MLTAFIMFIRLPPVIWDVSVYLKSARAGTLPKINMAQRVVAMVPFIRFLPGV
jgi:hypothetical protein